MTQLWSQKGHGPQQIGSSIQVLKEVLSGVAADGHLNPHQINTLKDWAHKNQHLRHKPPFSEIISTLEHAVTERKFAEEDLTSVHWLMDAVHGPSPVLADMAFLHGMVKRVSPEGHLSLADMGKLRDWLNARNHLQNVWPYAELFHLLTSFKYVEHIPGQDVEILASFLKDFLSKRESAEVILTAHPQQTPIRALCNLSPQVIFEKKKFCLAGGPRKNQRQDLNDLILQNKGVPTPQVSPLTDYLVVCNEAPTAWRFSAYGTKVAQALDLRQSGRKIQIILESDLWEAVEAAA